MKDASTEHLSQESYMLSNGMYSPPFLIEEWIDSIAGNQQDKKKKKNALADVCGIKKAFQYVSQEKLYTTFTKTLLKTNRETNPEKNHALEI